MKNEITPDSAYEDVWKPIVENEDGELDLTTIKGLLFDYGAMLHANTILYPYLTDGRVTHPQHDVFDVITESDQSVADSIEEGIQSVLSHLLDVLEIHDDEPAENRLQAVTDQINRFYERPKDVL